MSNLVQFPGLGIELNVPRVAFTFFGLEIYWYGVIIVTGLVLAVLFAASQAKRFGIDADRMYNVVMVGLVCALIGLRLYYILPSDTATLADFFNFRDGGLGIYGGIIGAFIGAFVACRIWKVPVLPLFDLGGMGFLIGQSIGRWANFFNQEAFGTNTTLPWGMISGETTAFLQYRQAALAAEGVFVDPSLPVHPTFLYESLWCALGLLLLFLYRKKRHFNGEIFLFYIMWYGIGRFFIESLRTDALISNFLGLRLSMVMAATTVAGALAVWIMARVKTAGKPLQVPEVPDRQYSVKLATADGPTVVKVSWPANTKQPKQAELEQMAKAQLEEAAEDTATGAGVEEPAAETDGAVQEKQAKAGSTDAPEADVEEVNLEDGVEQAAVGEVEGGEEDPAKEEAGDKDAAKQAEETAEAIEAE